MSYHGKLQVLKNGTADAEIQLWAYQQLEKEFTLTDDEIAKLADDILGYQIYGYKESGVYEFARAILRKAQEK